MFTMNADRNASCPRRQLRFECGQVAAVDNGRAQLAEEGEKFGEKPDAMAGRLVQRDELDIVALDAVAGVMFAKGLNLVSKGQFNPLIGAAGISAFPMAARVVHKVAQEEDFENYLLMHAMGANAAGQIASVVAGGVLLALMGAS